MFAHIFHGSVKNFLAIFSLRAMPFHMAAILITTALVLAGVDWTFYEATRSTLWHPIVWIAGIGGFFVPVLVPLGLYLFGEFRRDPALMHIAGRVAQAVILASLLAILYKALTGRIEPEFIYTVGVDDISREFQFGFLRHGIFWGWPSSHAAVACAGAIVLARLMRVCWITAASFIYTVIVCVGAAVGFHWLSDVIAGAIFGTLVGLTVSKETSLLK